MGLYLDISLFVGGVLIIYLIEWALYRPRPISPAGANRVQSMAWTLVPPNITRYIRYEGRTYRAISFQELKTPDSGDILRYRCEGMATPVTLFKNRWAWNTANRNAHFGISDEIIVLDTHHKTIKDHLIEKLESDLGLAHQLIDRLVSEKGMENLPDNLKKSIEGMEKLAVKATNLEGFEPGGLEQGGMPQNLNLQNQGATP